MLDAAQFHILIQHIDFIASVVVTFLFSFFVSSKRDPLDSFDYLQIFLLFVLALCCWLQWIFG